MPLLVLAGQALAIFTLSFGIGYLPLVFRELQRGGSDRFSFLRFARKVDTTFFTIAIERTVEVLSGP